MPVFNYKAIDPTTTRISQGVVEADNLRGAKEQLRHMGQIPTQIDEKVESGFSVIRNIPLVGQIFSPSMGMKELNILTEQLATLLDAGIPLIEALYMLEQQTFNPRVQEVLHKVRGDIIAGDSFSVSLGRFPNEFPGLYVSLVEAGEVSGELDKICFRLADLYAKMLALKARIQSAMIYPAITLFVIVAVIAVILVVAVPMFKKLFESKGADLPLPTIILTQTSDFVINFWWAILGVGAVVTIWLNIMRKGPGKPFIDRAILKIPFLGAVIRKVNISRFVRTLATVLSSGVSLTEALHSASATVDNVVIHSSFSKAKDSLMLGGSLARPLEQTGMFPLMVTRMIAIGEETGEMEKMLNKAADFLDLEVDASVDTMTKMIEPFMIVVMGGILTFVALALYLPLFDMGNVVARG